MMRSVVFPILILAMRRIKVLEVIIEQGGGIAKDGAEDQALVETPRKALTYLGPSLMVLAGGFMIAAGVTTMALVFVGMALALFGLPLFVDGISGICGKFYEEQEKSAFHCHDKLNSSFLKKPSLSEQLDTPG